MCLDSSGSSQGGWQGVQGESGTLYTGSFRKNFGLNILILFILSTGAKGGLHLGKPSQIWISPNMGGGGSTGPPDPDFLHVNQKYRFLG